MSVSPTDGVTATLVQPAIYRGSNTPTSGRIGDLWIDTTTNPGKWKELTTVPNTWTEVGGSGGTPGGSDTQVQFNDSSAFAGNAGFVYNKTTNVLTLTGQVTVGSLVIPTVSQVASSPILDLAQTWNNGAVTFTAAKISITNSASASNSIIWDLSVGATSVFSVMKSGVFGLNSAGSGNFAGVGTTESSGVLRTGFKTFGDRLDFYTNGSSKFSILNGVGLGIANFTALQFSSGGDGTSAFDTGILRNGAGVLEINSGTGGTFRDLKLRQLYPDFTNTATVGAVTINKSCGQAIMAAAATTVVVTNNLVTTNSQVLCTIASDDTTATIKNVVTASGSFTIKATAAATADTKINFLVLNQ